MGVKPVAKLTIPEKLIPAAPVECSAETVMDQLKRRGFIRRLSAVDILVGANSIISTSKLIVQLVENANGVTPTYARKFVPLTTGILPVFSRHSIRDAPIA